MISDSIEALKPVILMVIGQASLAGIIIFYKLAGTNGMNFSVLLTYRFAFAAASITPVAIILERKSRPPLTWLILFQSCLASLLIGSLAQNMYARGIALTSATFATAMMNLLPAFTFILAILFRMEKVGWNRMAGKAKVFGTLTCIGGAMFLSFYNGKEIDIWPTIVNLVELVRKPGGDVVANHHGNLSSMGIFLILVSCVSWAAGLIVQSMLMKNYPCPYSCNSLMLTMMAIQSAVYALCTESDWNQWKLGWNIRLLAASYCGIIGSAFTYTVIAWCIKLRGAMYASIFNPLILIIVAIAGSLILDEKLHVGSVVGSVIIIMGVYMVVWAKSKEANNLSQNALDQNNYSSHHSIAGSILMGLGFPSERLNFPSARQEIVFNENTSSRVVPLVDDVDAYDHSYKDKDKDQEKEVEECDNSKRLSKREIIDLV